MIYMELPLIPVSFNHLYMTIRKGPKTLRVLTKEGRKFKKEATAHLARTYPKQLATFKKNRPYALYLRFHLEDLTNKTWPESADSRYKKFDATNRIKVIEDVLVDVSAVDDSHYMITTVEKRQGTPERTEIWVWNLEEEQAPFNAAALSL
jgi:Holliday junction resolvase RusA-like endonuclease